MASQSTQNKFIRAIEELGWQVERTRGNHFRAVAPFNPTTVVIIPCTPGRGRSLMNTRGDIRRAYRVAALPIPNIPKL